MRRKGIKRFLVFLMVLSMMFGLVQTVFADGYEPDRKGSFTLTLRKGAEGSDQEALPGVGIQLYKGGSVKDNGGTIGFEIDPALESTGVDFSKLTTAEASVEAANKLEKLVKSSRLNLVQKGTTNEQGVVVFGKDSEGNALLDSGMYLIVQSESTGNTKVSPMLLSLPYITSDDWLYDVEAYPKAETHEVTTTPAPTATPKTTTPVRSTINTPTTSGTAKSVKTGDDTPIAAWIGVLAAAAVIIGAVVVLRKKKKEKR